MDIQIKSLKFDADKKLVEFVEKKVSRLERFFPGDNPVADVTLSLEKDSKGAKIKIHIPGEELVIDRSASTFEDAITVAVDAMKEKLTRAKEKLQEK